MNDRFKFRVFDKEYKDYLPEGVLLDGRTGKVSGVNVDRYTIEQCTGIQDRNNKLIYEGDVVKLKSICYGVNSTVEIYYGGVQWRTRDLSNGLTAVFSPGIYCCEVIGNIHEMEVAE